MEGTLKLMISWMILGFMVCPEVWAAVQSSEDFGQSVSLVKDDVYQLFWKNDDTSITFEVHAKVKGWVGFGLSPNGGMAKSDIVIGWVKDGVSFFKDRYADQQGGMPTVDASQDWTLLAAEETSTHTVLKFKRPLYSCDPEDRNVTADTSRVIFAYSDIDPTSEDSVIYHKSNRGTKSLFLMGSAEKVSPMPADAFYKDFLNNNFTIPHDSQTTYWCQGFNAPSMTEKHHLIKIEPIVQPGNEAFFHHFLIHACYRRPGDIDRIDEPEGELCSAHTKPWRVCQVVVAQWGVGAGAFHFPEHAGLAFGDSGGILFLRTETHYNNYYLRQGVVDSSGLRLWFTKSLRQHDVGLLSLGMNVGPVGHILPAGYPSIVSHGHCTKECLSKGMGAVPEVHVFRIHLHTHLLGTGVRVHHYRDGVEKAYLASDMAYDFNYQQTRRIDPEIIIKQGDNIVTECFYNTKDKQDATLGGDGTTEEMCISFLFYYPRINLMHCGSNPTQANMAEHLKLKYEGGHRTSFAKITEGPYSGKTVTEFFQAIGKLPEQATMDEYQEALKTGEILETCMQVSGTTRRTTQVATVMSTYQKEVHQCSGALTRQPPDAIMLIMLSYCGFLLILAIILTTNYCLHQRHPKI